MKYQLNESSQKRQKAILDALKTGVPLAGLLAVTALTGGGCGSSDSTVGITAPVPAESAKAPAPQLNRPNENQDPALRGKPVTVGDIPANGINEGKPDIPPLPGAPLPPERQLELPKQTAVYRAVKGDTMWKIAKAHNTTLDVLLALNRMSREQAAKIIVGQEIIVPAEHGK